MKNRRNNTLKVLALILIIATVNLFKVDIKVSRKGVPSQNILIYSCGGNYTVNLDEKEFYYSYPCETSVGGCYQDFSFDNINDLYIGLHDDSLYRCKGKGSDMKKKRETWLTSR